MILSARIYLTKLLLRWRLHFLAEQYAKARLLEKKLERLKSDWIVRRYGA